MTDAPALNPLTDPGDFFVRYVPENLERFPGLDDAVEGFRTGERPAARAAEAWLKAIDLNRPLESLTRLYFVDGLLRGFYSLANGQVTIAARKRERLGLGRKVQPAVILTWIAKSAVHPCDGAAMVEDAVFRARTAATVSAATVLALDPFDAETANMWRRNHGFIDAVAAAPGDDKLPRLIVPLRAPN